MKKLNVKRLAALAMTLVMLLGVLTACGDKADTNNGSGDGEGFPTMTIQIAHVNPTTDDDQYNKLATLFAYQLVAAITLVVLIAAAAIQVVTRYVMAQPPGWTDELARFAFVWCSALGAVVALDKGMHAGITLLEEKLPEAGRRVLKIICTILVIAMAALVGVKGVSLVSVTVTVLSPSLHLSMAIINVSICLCGFGMALVGLVQLLELLTGSKDAVKVETMEEIIEEGGTAE